MKPRESRPSSLLIGQQLTEAIRLAGSEVRSAPSSIHDLRVGLKRLRAWAHLTKPALTLRADYQSVDRRLRDAGRMLSASRDARVLGKTLRRIHARTKGKSARRIEAWCAELAEVQVAEIPWDRVRTELALSAHMLHGVDWLVVTPEALLERLGATYRRTRRLGRKVLPRRNPPDEWFHDLRKSVKRLGYQVEYTDRMFPLRHSRGAALARMGQNLGDLNDLLLLRRWLQGKGLEQQEAKILKLVNKRIRRKTLCVQAQFDELFKAGAGRFLAEYRTRRDDPAAPAGSQRMAEDPVSPPFTQVT